MSVLSRQHKSFISLFAGFDGNGQYAFDGSEFAVKGEFTHDNVLIQVLLGSNLLGSLQHAKGNGQVVGGAFFTNVSGGQVHHDFLAGHFVSRTFEGGFDPVFALLHGTVGQANQIKP